MPGKSKVSRPVTVRLPNEVYETLKRRYGNVSEYLRERITYDTTRKHIRRKAK